MSPTLLHVYGPFSINVYGACIVLGILAGLLLAKHDRILSQLIDFDTLLTLVGYTIVVAIIGGRILHSIEHWDKCFNLGSFFNFWEPGYSVLGALIAGKLFAFFYLKKVSRSPVAIMDRLVIYLPLVHSIARLGCYCAGCCYGTPTYIPWAVVYTNPEQLAPCFIPFHPTQLYSAGALLGLFFALVLLQKRFSKTGELTGLYLIGAGIERFVVDFLRADRTLVTSIVSSAQLIAALVVCAGLLILYQAHYARAKH